jgi:hypothetical protein
MTPTFCSSDVAYFYQKGQVDGLEGLLEGSITMSYWCPFNSIRMCCKGFLNH